MLISWNSYFLTSWTRHLCSWHWRIRPPFLSNIANSSLRCNERTCWLDASEKKAIGGEGGRVHFPLESGVHRKEGAAFVHQKQQHQQRPERSSLRQAAAEEARASRRNLRLRFSSIFRVIFWAPSPIPYKPTTTLRRRQNRSSRYVQGLVPLFLYTKYQHF